MTKSESMANVIAWMMLDAAWQMRSSQYWRARDFEHSGRDELREVRDRTEAARARVYWNADESARTDIRQLHQILRVNR